MLWPSLGLPSCIPRHLGALVHNLLQDDGTGGITFCASCFSCLQKLKGLSGCHAGATGDRREDQRSGVSPFCGRGGSSLLRPFEPPEEASSQGQRHLLRMVPDTAIGVEGFGELFIPPASKF